MVRQVARAMTRRIGIEIDAKRTAIRTVIHLDRQVIDRAEREIVRNGAIAGKTEIVVEAHDVQAEPEQAPAVDAADGSPQICNWIELMLQPAAKLQRALGDDIGYRHAWMQRQPQRHHV